MAKSLTDEDDIQGSLDGSANQEGGGKNLKIPEGKTPIHILSEDYADGYIHWAKLPDGSLKRLACLGGLEGHGWVPDTCPLCGVVAQLYKQAKSLEKEEGETAEVKKLRKKAFDLRAKYEAHFLAAVGELVREKDAKTGNKIFVPEFDQGKVGILSMTRQQYENFTALRNSESFEFMKGPEDLINRVIILDKAKRDGSAFATIEFIPSKRQSESPKIEYEADDFDLEEDFELDEDTCNEVVELIGSFDEEDDSPTDTKSKKAARRPSKKSAEEVEDTLFDEGEEAKTEEFVDDFVDDPLPETKKKTTTKAKAKPAPVKKAAPPAKKKTTTKRK
jgi:hypothetical protein